MTYGEVEGWARTMDVIGNRARVINQMLGYGVDGSLANPCQVRMRDGAYTVTWCGERFGTVRLYEQEDADTVRTRLEGLNDGLWFALGAGVLCTTT